MEKRVGIDQHEGTRPEEVLASIDIVKPSLGNRLFACPFDLTGHYEICSAELRASSGEGARSVIGGRRDVAL